MKASQFVGISLAIAAAIACGKVAQQQEPKLEPASAPLSSAAPEEEAAPDASAAASASSAAPKPEEKPKSGRPVPTYQNPTQPTPVGIDGAVLKFASGLELRIPSGAMRDARNILITEDKRTKGSSGKLGSVYSIEITVGGEQYFPGQQRASQAYGSHGDAFVLKLPLPAGTESANLAVETVAKEGKKKVFTSSWSVTAMTRRENASPANRAVFELRALPDGHVHLTSEAPESTSGTPAGGTPAPAAPAK